MLSKTSLSVALILSLAVLPRFKVVVKVTVMFRCQMLILIP
jgi:hypothetical protein